MVDAIVPLIDHVLDRQFDDLPDTARQAVKIFFLDTVGVTVAGSTAPFADKVLESARTWGDAGQAAVFGTRYRLPAVNAALVNGFFAHCQEYDCVHEGAVVHPLATIQSALLAVAESRSTPVTGRELMTALALGVDVSTSIGMAAKSGLKFFRPAAAGIFGATAAVAKLHGCDRAQLQDAFGLALTQAANTMQGHIEGKPSLALSIGFAARASITAVEMARLGFSGPHNVLEGPFGFYPLFEGEWDTAPVWAELGQTWRITEVSHKPFPSGRATHGGLDAIFRLQAAHEFSAADIQAVTLSGPPLIHQLVGRPIAKDMTTSYARLCFQYVGATALLNGTVGLSDYSADLLQADDRQALANRISVEIDGNPDPNALAPQRLTVLLKDGRTLQETIADTLGSPSYPLTRDRHLQKFRTSWQHSGAPLPPENCQRVIDCADRLEEQQDIRDLLGFLRPADH